jgi:hypothetical protein
MKITQRQHGLRIVDGTYLLGICVFAMAIVCVVMFIEMTLHGRPVGDRVGALLALFLTLVCGAGFTQGGEFDFDVLRRNLIWTRRSLFGSRCKTIPFNDIEAAIVQREALDHPADSRCIEPQHGEAIRISIAAWLTGLPFGTRRACVRRSA